MEHGLRSIELGRIGRLLQLRKSRQVELERLQLGRGGLIDVAGDVAGEHDLQHADDGSGQVVLDRQQVFPVAVIGLRPDPIARIGVDELRGHAQVIALPAHTALQDVAHSEGMGDLADVAGTPLEGVGRGLRRNPDAGYACQAARQLLGQAVREILIAAAWTDVDERQYGDRLWLLDDDGGLRARAAREPRQPARMSQGVRCRPDGSAQQHDSCREDERVPPERAATDRLWEDCLAPRFLRWSRGH